MIAAEPTTHEERLTILEGCNESEIASEKIISLRPILFFSYEGQVAVAGIVTTHSSMLANLQRKGSSGSISGDLSDINSMYTLSMSIIFFQGEIVS